MSKTEPRSNEPSTSRRGTVDGVAKRMERILKNEDLSDVRFSVGRFFGPAKIFTAHKFVLSSASDVFYTMFHGSLPVKGDGTIDIPDILPEAFDNMLKYVYTDARNVSANDVFPTMMCADKYDLPLLVDYCFEFFVNDLIADGGDIDRYLLHLENALTWAVGIESVVETCLHFVDVNCKQILKSERFNELQPTTLRRILERETLSVGENLICLAMDRWTVAACNRSNLEPTPINRRDVLGELFYLIRFPVMTVMQMADLPADSGFLEVSSLWEIHHHKERFSTLRRGSPVIRVGNVHYRRKEEIFVKRLQDWRPAVVIGARGSAVLCMRTTHPQQVLQEQPENIIRASAILTINQPVLHPVGSDMDYIEEATYWSLDSDGRGHVIKVGRKFQKVKFSEIFLHHTQAQMWKAVHDPSSSRKDDNMKKRSRDTAGFP